MPARTKRAVEPAAAPPGPGIPTAARSRRRVPAMAAATLALALSAVFAWAAFSNQDASREPKLWTHRVIRSIPHDVNAFTQGLIVDGDSLIEGTGRYGQSSIRRIDLSTGRILRRVDLQEQIFGEGLTAVGDEIYQLTWKNQVCYVYDRETFAYKRRLSYRGEGWGLTYDGQRLVMSDGSSVLKFVDPKTFRVTRTLAVRDRGRRVDRLNELEYVKGEIWANVWYLDRIARISPRDGRVLGWIDLSGIISDRERGDPEHVLNGIAFDEATGRTFVTGKNWPKIFEIEVVPAR